MNVGSTADNQQEHQAHATEEVTFGWVLQLSVWTRSFNYCCLLCTFKKTSSKSYFQSGRVGRLIMLLVTRKWFFSSCSISLFHGQTQTFYWWIIIIIFFVPDLQSALERTSISSWHVWRAWKPSSASIPVCCTRSACVDSTSVWRKASHVSPQALCSSAARWWKQALRVGLRIKRLSLSVSPGRHRHQLVRRPLRFAGRQSFRDLRSSGKGCF